MKVALVNPPWSFGGSLYSGCREPHLPIEYGYTAALLAGAGHRPTIVDAQARGLSLPALRDEVRALAPDVLVVTTAPSYLCWRCPPPELRVPQETMRALHGIAPLAVAVGPHATATPGAAIRKLGVDVAVVGECEEVVAELCERPPSAHEGVASIAFRSGDGLRRNGGPHASELARLPALAWDDASIVLHAHHHRSDAPARGPGAEIEASRGSRRRPLEVVMEELDRLIAQGVGYVYFIDESFLPRPELLEGLARRDVRFGVQLRIDAWSPEMLDRLGEAGCVSVEADVESTSPERSVERLARARRAVPVVFANLLAGASDDPAAVAAFRDELRERGVRMNDPSPLFPYPGSPDYRLRWGTPDDRAWERAVDHHLGALGRLGDRQHGRPRPLADLELEVPER